jgi:hypothetical protein
MDRRTLLKCLLATPMAALVDYERLLWVPTPIITVPARGLSYDDILAATLHNFRQTLDEVYRRENAFLSYLVNKQPRSKFALDSTAVAGA